MRATDAFAAPMAASNPDAPPSLTIGIEEEYMVLDPRTFDLRSHIDMELISQGRMVLREHVKPEMHGSMLEVGTGVCRTIQEAHFEIVKIRSIIAHIAKQNGLLIGAASTHPFARWQDQPIYPDEHYQNVVRDMQMLARSLLIFGMHVHIGIENRETQIQIMNVIRYFLPHILCISTNSPFWMGMETGLMSYRSKLFERFPRTGIPDYFSSWAQFVSYVDVLMRTGCIDNPKKIWWDVRPHPKFPTLEIRVCDLPMRVDETIAIAALIQAIVAKLYKLFAKNLTFRVYPRILLVENKWRAVRYGLEGKLIDFGKQKELPAPDLIRELIEFVDDVVDELGTRRYIEYIYQILEMGSGAQRQFRVWRETNSFEAVARYIHEETMIGLLDDVSPYLVATTLRPPSPEAVQEKLQSITKPDDLL